jgi:hypothetical protein
MMRAWLVAFGACRGEWIIMRYWHGTYIGPPSPVGTEYDHTAVFDFGCDGLEGSAAYHYPYFDVTCQSKLTLIETTVDSYVYEDATITQGCVDGRLTVTPVKTDGGLRFEWRRPPGAPNAELSVGFAKPAGTAQCP